MAITISKNLTSNYFYSSANPIEIIVESNNSGKCNFRYICDIYLNSTKVHTLKLFPDPISGKGFFNIQRIVEDYIETLIYLQPSGHILNAGTNAAIPNAAMSIQCKFGEEYDNSVDCSGNVAQYINLTNSNLAWAFEGGIDWELFPGFSTNSYVFGTSSATGLFLSNSPKEVKITYNDQYCLDFLSLQNINIADWKVDVKTYDQSGLGIATHSFATNKTHTIRRYRIFCGPYDINRVANAAIINPAVAKYTIQLRWGASAIVSETYTFKLKKPEAFQTRFCFTGQWGSPEHYTFFHRKRSGYNISKGLYQKVVSPRYSVGDRGISTFGIVAQQNGNVSSFVAQEESEWLTEMWLSPNVYVYQRPELFEAKVVATGSGVATILYSKPEWATGSQNNLVVGGKLFFHSQSNSGLYNIISLTSDNLVEVSATFSGNECGWIYKNDTFQKLPIVISNDSVEIQQRLGRPIQYTFDYTMAYTKTTLRG